MANQIFMRVNEVAEELGVSVPYAYKLIRQMNEELEKACRVADFLEFAQLLCYDALNRQESCGAHFRVEYQLPDGEAKRNDDEYAYVAAWEYTGVDSLPVLHKEPLTFENVHLAIRSYK